MGATLSLGCGGDGRSLLNSAENGDAQTIKEVLTVRPELAALTTFGSGQSIVHIASVNGDREVLQAVVQVLQHAAKAPAVDGDPGALKALDAVTMGRYLKDVLNTRTRTGQTPLMLACINGHVSCVNFLLRHGADVFQVDKVQRRSAIHHAAAAGQAGVLRALLGPDQLMHTEEGLVPLRHVRVHDVSGQCRYIDSRAENGMTALHLAAAAGELACVHVLLECGASMMVRTVDLGMAASVSIPAGSTPLHLAAHKGLVAIVQAMLQAQADALGDWAPEDGEDAAGRRGWEQDGRIDLRSVANSLRQLPYHVAWQRGFRETAHVLNPTIPIDAALENVRELDEGFGCQRLSTLAAYALRKALLAWLEAYQARWEAAQQEKELRSFRERVIAEQKRKEALKLHREASVDASLAAGAAAAVSRADAGHTFAAPPRLQPAGGSSDLEPLQERSDELLSTSASLSAARQESAATPASPPPAPREPEPPLSPAGGGLPPPRRNSSKSRRRLQPSRPAPPPPARMNSASGRALALAADAASLLSPRVSCAPSQHHSRRVSWDPDAEPLAAPVVAAVQSPVAAPAALCTPFASPFAAAAQEGAGEEDERSARPSARICAHPSGVDLVDPPEGAGAVIEAPLPLTVPRSSSKTLLGALPSFSRGGRRSQQLRREASGRVDFARAASIPGFEHNLDGDEDCGICLDAPVNVGVNGCRHQLCCACALKLCEVNKKPPVCPFCRTCIEGFHEARA